MKLKNGFTMIELLVVVGLMVILVSLLQPSLVRMLDNAQALKCMNVHRMIQTAHTYYMDDNEHHMVSLGLRGNPGPDALMPTNWVTWWPDSLRSYLDGLDSVTCPTVEKYGIGMNHPELGVWLRKGTHISAVRDPAKTVAFADSAVVENTDEQDPDLWLARNPERPTIFFRTPNNLPWFNTLPARVYARHSGKTNALFADGHAEYLYPKELGFEFPKNHPKAYWDK